MANNNLPPGVSVNDLPGNQPIDTFGEQVFKHVSEDSWNLIDAKKSLYDKAWGLIEKGFHDDTSAKKVADNIEELIATN